jgi:hypothetical protein
MTDYPLGMLQKSDGIHVAVFATSAYVAKAKNVCRKPDQVAGNC